MKNLLFIIFFLSIGGTSCKKFLETDPPKTQLVSATVFERDETAISALAGIYGQMMEGPNILFNGSITLCTGLTADELIPTGQEVYVPFYNNALLPSNEIVTGIWSSAYNYIYQANAVIEGLTNSNQVTSDTKKRLMGEAKFIRAFCHFYLVNVFGEVPYATTTQYTQNEIAKRISVLEVYNNIITDLTEAQTMLGGEDETAERARPGKWAVKALLARVYLYLGDWVNAELVSNEIINSTSLYGLESDLNRVFLPDSKEVIWQLKPVDPGENNTGEGFMFISDPSVPPAYASLSDHLMNAFETDDLRKTSWVSSYTNGQLYNLPFKYKVRTSSPLMEYYVVFRLAEQFLIRAEARAHRGKSEEAIQDIDMIRQRAGLPLIASTNPELTGDGLLTAIAQERQIELFAEWGHRWMDLKRTGQANAVLGVIKNNWSANDQLYPIPKSEIDNNISSSQNPGY